MAFGLCGERVRLVPLNREKHAATFHQLVNDYEICDGLSVNPPHSMDQQLSWFDRAVKAETDVIFAIELLDGTTLGVSGLESINQPLGTATTYSFIGPKENWGQGLAVEANRLRSRYAFEILGLRVLYSGYFGNNEKSGRMQAKVGYLQCGRFPQKYWKKDAYVDDIITYLTRERFLELEAEGYASVS